MSISVDALRSFAASAMRVGAGMTCRQPTRRPELPLDATLYPCPKGGTRFRPQLRELGGKQFPYLVDPNTGTEMFESDAILRYLETTYGA